MSAPSIKAAGKGSSVITPDGSVLVLARGT